MPKHKLIFVTSALSLLIATAVSAQLFSSKQSATPANKPTTIAPMSSTDFNAQVQNKVATNQSALDQKFNSQISALPSPKISKDSLPPPMPAPGTTPESKGSSVIPAAQDNSSAPASNAAPTAAPAPAASKPYTPPPAPPTTTTIAPSAQPYTGFQSGNQPAPANAPANNSSNSGGWNIKY